MHRLCINNYISLIILHYWSMLLVIHMPIADDIPHIHIRVSTNCGKLPPGPEMISHGCRPNYSQSGCPSHCDLR